MKKREYKFGFVVLHYKNIEDTIECIKSLKYTNDLDTLIFIVDNFQNDGTKEQLESKKIELPYKIIERESVIPRK